MMVQYLTNLLIVNIDYYDYFGRVFRKKLYIL